MCNSSDIIDVEFSDNHAIDIGYCEQLMRDVFFVTLFLII